MSNVAAYDGKGRGRTTFTVPKARVFHSVNDLHRATLVGLVKVGLVDVESGKKIAHGIEQAIATYDAPENPESLDYLDFESRIQNIVGPVSSLLHIGRSRQDITSTLCGMEARHAARVSVDGILKVRANILQVAEKHIDTVIPAYTHGVPAQPTTFAHYMLAFYDSLARHNQRLEEPIPLPTCRRSVLRS